MTLARARVDQGIKQACECTNMDSIRKRLPSKDAGGGRLAEVDRSGCFAREGEKLTERTESTCSSVPLFWPQMLRIVPSRCRLIIVSIWLSVLFLLSLLFAICYSMPPVLLRLFHHHIVVLCSDMRATRANFWVLLAKRVFMQV